MATSLEFKLPSDPCPMPTMGSDDEESFVVLGKSLIPDVDLSFNNLHIEPVQSGPIEEGKKLINMELSQMETSTLPQMPNMYQQMNDQDTTISVTTISTELSPDEVQQKVDTLIAENIKLRETIIKNNTAMETQHERIVAWKEDVQKTHQAHKLKFAEAKDFITRLKADNELLKLELEKSNEIREMQQRELFRYKDELKEKEGLPFKVFKDAGTDVQGTSLAGSKVLAQFGQNRISELESLVQKLGESNTANEDELKLSKARITELERLLQIIHIAKDKLADENAQLKSKHAHTDSLKQLSTEIEEKNKIIEELNDKLKENKIGAEKVIKALNTDIINLRSQLCLHINLQEDLDNTRKQLMGSQASITGLQQANTVLTAQLTVEQEKVRELQKFEALKDDFFALQQQLDLYKTDFEVERLAKESLQAERDQIKNDFLQIQKRNNELNEEIEIIKERGFVSVVHPDSRGPPSSSSSSASSQGSPIRSECPICLRKYRSLKLLEQHVDTCIPEPSWL